MKFIKRDGSPANAEGKRFGGGFKPHGFGGPRPSFGGGFNAGFKKPLFPAKCDGCGKECGVPFRPNGSKPVYCQLCFKRDDSAPRAERPAFGGDRPSYAPRPSFGARPAFAPRAEFRPRPAFVPAAPAANDGAKWAEVNMKLDRIMREIEAMKGNKETDGAVEI